MKAVWQYDVVRDALDPQGEFGYRNTLNYCSSDSFSGGIVTVSIPQQDDLLNGQRWWGLADSLLSVIYVEQQLVPMVSENPGQYDAVTNIKPFLPSELQEPAPFVS